MLVVVFCTCVFLCTILPSVGLSAQHAFISLNRRIMFFIQKFLGLNYSEIRWMEIDRKEKYQKTRIWNEDERLNVEFKNTAYSTLIFNISIRLHGYYFVCFFFLIVVLFSTFLSFCLLFSHHWVVRKIVCYKKKKKKQKKHSKGEG